jgi:endonuclease-3
MPSMGRSAAFLKHVPAALGLIRRASAGWKKPVVGLFATGENGPFKVLVSTVISLRTKDAVTEAASLRLFALADTPAKLLALPASRIEKAIYPAGFYRTKTRNLLEIARILTERFGGRVPDDLETLLTLPGVGRKTANLVLTVGYSKSGICVDTHVHRISNRWGLVKTATPDETEAALRKVLPERYWIGLNDALVSYGQNLCVPVSPFCSSCKLSALCPKKGVRSRR